MKNIALILPRKTAATEAAETKQNENTIVLAEAYQELK